MKKLLYLFIFSVQLSAGQNLKDELLNATERISSLGQYSVSVEYRLLLDDVKSKAFQTSKTEVYKSGNSLLMKNTDGEEYLINNNFDVFVNHSRKTISVRKKQMEAAAENESPGKGLLGIMDLNLTLFIKMCDKVSVIRQDSKSIQYYLKFKPSVRIESMTITFDKEAGMFSLIKYVYREPQAIKELKNAKHKVTIEVAYGKISTTVEEKAGFFNERKYINLINGTIKAHANYKGYKLEILN